MVVVQSFRGLNWWGSSLQFLGCVSMTRTNWSVRFWLLNLAGQISTRMNELLTLFQNQQLILGTIPTGLGQLSSSALRILNLCSNRFTTGRIPTELSKLSALVGALRLHRKELTSTIPNGLSQLMTAVYCSLLFLFLNQLTGTIVLTELGQAAHCSVFFLHRNNNIFVWSFVIFINWCPIACLVVKLPISLNLNKLHKQNA